MTAPRLPAVPAVLRIGSWSCPLGRMPLANALLSSNQLEQNEPADPLDLAFCPRCTLV